MRRRICILTAGLSVVLTATALAVDHSGSVSPGSAAFKWSGGPLNGAVVTTDVGDNLECDDPGKDCDDTLLKTEAGQVTTHILGSNDSAADLDFYVYKSDSKGTVGTFVKSSAEFSSDETITFDATAGYYLLRVVAATSFQGTYDGDAVEKVKASGPAGSGGDQPVYGNDPNAPGGSGGTGGSGDGTTTGGSGGTGTSGSEAPGLAPTTTATKPSGKRIRTLRGTAKDRDGTIAYVDVAVMRVRGAKCEKVTARGRLRKASSCKSPAYLRARGKSSWRLALPRTLPKGSYIVLARATDNDGRTEGGFGPANRKRFSVG